MNENYLGIQIIHTINTHPVLADYDVRILKWLPQTSGKFRTMCQCFLNHQLVADSQVVTLNYHHRLRPSSSSILEYQFEKQVAGTFTKHWLLPTNGGAKLLLRRGGHCVHIITLVLLWHFFTHSPVYTHHIFNSELEFCNSGRMLLHSSNNNTFLNLPLLQGRLHLCCSSIWSRSSSW